MVPLTVVETDALKNAEVAANDEKRCYYCKTNLFTQLKKTAYKNGYTLLLDGTNASDNYEDRPGMRALQELGGSFSAARMWLDQSKNPAAVTRSWSVHPRQTLLCVPCHPDSDRHYNYPCSTANGRTKRRNTFFPWLHRLPYPILPQCCQNTAARK